MKWIIIFIIGVAIGVYFRNRGDKKIVNQVQDDKGSFPNAQQIEEKRQNLEKILSNFGPDDEITNDKVQAILGVANSSAERYLDELEKQGKLRQIGTLGKYVIYKKVQ